MRSFFSGTLSIACLSMLCSAGLHAAEKEGAPDSGNKLSITGLIEAEASAVNPNGGKSTSGLILSTFELGLEAKVNDEVSAHATLLYEEDGDDELLVDEAFVRLAPANLPFTIEAGRMTQAFGDFSTGMVADPLTLELAETKHHGTLRLGYEQGLFAATLSAFRADVQKNDDDSVNTIVASISVADEESEELRYRAGASWTNNIAATDGLSGDYDDGAGGFNVTASMVSGVGLYGAVGLGDVELRAEYITAADRFDDGARAGRQPLAWNLEAGYAFSEPWLVTVRYAGATDFDIRNQYGAAVACEVMENTGLALEYLHEKGRDGIDREMFTLQLAMEF